MPKLNYLKSAKEKQAALLAAKIEKMREDIRGAVGEFRGRHKLLQNDVALKAGFTVGTFSNRMKYPEKFTFDEAVRMEAALPGIKEHFIKALQRL